MDRDVEPITALLARWRSGDTAASEALLPIVYHYLRDTAGSLMRSERPDHTLQPTALLHEAFLRLFDHRQPPWESRVHFYAFAARIMRQVLIDHARRRSAGKRSAGRLAPVPIDEVMQPARAPDVIMLDELLTELAAIDERKARILELRYFAGLSVEETCHSTGLSPATIRRESRLAEAWLHREITRSAPVVSLAKNL